MSLLRNLVAAGAVVFAGFAATANAAPGNPDTNRFQLNPKFKVHLCIPHYERKVIYRHFYKLLVIYYVDRHCHRRIVRVHRIPGGHHYGAR